MYSYWRTLVVDSISIQPYLQTYVFTFNAAVLISWTKIANVNKQKKQTSKQIKFVKIEISCRNVGTERKIQYENVVKPKYNCTNIRNKRFLTINKVYTTYLKKKK